MIQRINSTHWLRIFVEEYMIRCDEVCNACYSMPVDGYKHNNIIIVWLHECESLTALTAVNVFNSNYIHLYSSNDSMQSVNKWKITNNDNNNNNNTNNNNNKIIVIASKTIWKFSILFVNTKTKTIFPQGLEDYINAIFCIPAVQIIVLNGR